MVRPRRQSAADNAAAAAVVVAEEEIADGWITVEPPVGTGCAPQSRSWHYSAMVTGRFQPPAIPAEAPPQPERARPSRTMQPQSPTEEADEDVPPGAVVRLPRRLLRPDAAPPADRSPERSPDRPQAPDSEPDDPPARPRDRSEAESVVTPLAGRRRPPYFGRRNWTGLAVAAIAISGVGLLVARLYGAGWTGFAAMFQAQ